MDKSDFIWDIFQNYVRILGAQQVENPSKAVRVHFEGLQASVYVHGNWPRLAFKALKAIKD